MSLYNGKSMKLNAINIQQHEEKEAQRCAALHDAGLWDSPPSSEIDALIKGLSRHYDCNAAYLCLDNGFVAKIISGINVFEDQYKYGANTASQYREMIGRTLPIIISDARENQIESKRLT